jgi:hypothetical protein
VNYDKTTSHNNTLLWLQFNTVKYDDSYYHRTVGSMGGVKRSSFAMWNESAQFFPYISGSYAYINVTAFNNGAIYHTGTGSKWTISLWIYDTNKTGCYIADNNKPSTSPQTYIGWYLCTNNGNATLTLGYPAMLYHFDIDSMIRTNTSQWFHLVVQKNETGRYVLWVNGHMNGTYKSIASINQGAARRFRIGAYTVVGQPSTQLSGYIDDVVMYNYALTPAEIRSLYNSTRYPYVRNVPSSTGYTNVTIRVVNQSGVQRITNTQYLINTTSSCYYPAPRWNWYYDWNSTCNYQPYGTNIYVNNFYGQCLTNGRGNLTLNYSSRFSLSGNAIFGQNACKWLIQRIMPPLAAVCGNGILEAGESCDYVPIKDGECPMDSSYIWNGYVGTGGCTYATACETNCQSCVDYAYCYGGP